MMKRNLLYQMAIVEDDHLYANVLQRFLKKAFPKSNIAVYHSGEAYLVESSQNEDLVFLDLNLAMPILMRWTGKIY